MKISSMKLLGAVAVLLGIGAPARADTVTLDFSGTADLSGRGGRSIQHIQRVSHVGPVDRSFFHRIRRDRLLVRVLHSRRVQLRVEFHGYKLALNHAFRQHIRQRLWGPGRIYLCLRDFPPLAEGIHTDLYAFNEDLVGPTSMFSSAALPGNLDFLSSVTTSSSYWYTSADPYDLHDNPSSTTTGTFIATAPATAPVPEPASFTLTVLGLAGVLTRYRWRHSHSTAVTFYRVPV